MNTALRLLDIKSMSQPKILLVEDDQFDRVLIKRIIEDYYPFTLMDHAGLKSEACAYLRRNTYDVIFLDLNLPDNASITDIKEIKKFAGKTPIIIFTGHYDEAMAGKILSYEIDGILNKNDLVNQNFSAAILMAIQNAQDAKPPALQILQ